MNDNTNIIDQYQNIYTYSKRYLILVLAIIFGIGGYLLLSNFYSKHILLANEVDMGGNLENPFIIKDSSGISFPISQQNQSTQNDQLTTNDFLNQNIYITTAPDRSVFEKRMEDNQQSGSTSLSVNNNIIKYFNLGCMFTPSTINLADTKLCEENLDIFAKTFPKYNIEEDLGNFEKLINLARPKHQDLVCQNILQYIYQTGKIYSVFDNIMSTCPKETKIYSQIVELKKFTRDEKDNFSNKKYENSKINNLKLTSWMQYIYQELQKPKIDLPQVKKYLNRLANKAYLSDANSQKLQNIIYYFNNFMTSSLDNYQGKNSLSTEEIEYIKNIKADIQDKNASLTIDSNIQSNNNTQENIDTGDNLTTNSQQTDQTKEIDNLIIKYLGANIIESKFVSTDKYIYKISISETKRGILVIKTDNVWTLKTLLAGKQNGTYEKINDFSVKFDDSEKQRFEIFKQKAPEIYSKVK